VRVESLTRPDITHSLGPFKNREAAPTRIHAISDFNTSKLGISLNLKTPEATEIAKRLISWADVYVESFTPGTMTGFGIVYDTARQLNPSIIMVSTCLMGQTGPASQFAGYGFHAGAVAGFYDITGWPDLAPDGPWTAYTDAVTPRILSAIIMAAVDHRRRTGQGQYIDASQLEMGLQFLSPQILDYTANSRQVTRNGNRSSVAAPQGAYPCAGDDQWCAIAIESDEEWASLRRVLDNPDWAADDRFATNPGRLKNHDEIDGYISQWTAGLPPQEAMRLCQAEGVPAGVVQRSSDLFQDSQMAHRRMFPELDDPEVGRVPHTGHMFDIRGYDHGPRFAAPVFGQHNEQILKDLLGMTDDQITEATIAGALE
jgi:crotonobetainyl-CoA:carnitine CoA-transferase CaiB-like acyl-CoA transferase